MQGYEVLTSDGHNALKLISELHPDVIISDLVMPKLDGLALTRALREESPETPVIIITGKGSIDAAVDPARSAEQEELRTGVEPAAAQRARIREGKSEAGVRGRQIIPSDPHEGP